MLFWTTVLFGMARCFFGSTRLQARCKNQGEFAWNWTKLHGHVWYYSHISQHKTSRTRLLPCLAAPESMATQKLDKVSFVLLDRWSISCFVAIHVLLVRISIFIYIYIYLYRCVLYNNMGNISIYTYCIRGVILFCHIFRDHNLCFSKSLSTNRYTLSAMIWFCLDDSNGELERAQQLEEDFCLDQLRNWHVLS